MNPLEPGELARVDDIVRRIEALEREQAIDREKLYDAIKELRRDLLEDHEDLTQRMDAQQVAITGLSDTAARRRDLQLVGVPLIVSLLGLMTALLTNGGL